MFDSIIKKYKQWKENRKHLNDLKSKGIHCVFPKCGELIANRFIVFSYNAGSRDFQWGFPFKHPWIEGYDIVDGEYVIGAIINNFPSSTITNVMWSHKTKLCDIEGEIVINQLTYETKNNEITSDYREDY